MYNFCRALHLLPTLYPLFAALASRGTNIVIKRVCPCASRFRDNFFALFIITVNYAVMIKKVQCIIIQWSDQQLEAVSLAGFLHVTGQASSVTNLHGVRFHMYAKQSTVTAVGIAPR